MNPPFYFRPVHQTAFNVPHFNYSLWPLRNRRLHIVIPTEANATKVSMKVFPCFRDKERIMEIHFIMHYLNLKEPIDTTKDSGKFRFAYLKLTKLPRNVDLVLLKVNEATTPKICDDHDSSTITPKPFEMPLYDSFDHLFPWAKFKYICKGQYFKNKCLYTRPRDSFGSAFFLFRWISAIINFVLGNHLIPKDNPGDTPLTPIDSCTIPPK